jgi:ribonuclease P protein component
VVGFVVSRAVGNAVARNTVKRRLRGLMAGEVGYLPDGALVVVRALPAAAGASSAELGRDLGLALASANRTGPRGRATT